MAIYLGSKKVGAAIVVNSQSTTTVENLKRCCKFTIHYDCRKS